MYEYVVDTIEMVTRGLTWTPMVDPTDVIHRRAAEGWRFCQIYTPPNATGITRTIQVIFERPLRAPQDAWQQPDA